MRGQVVSLPTFGEARKSQAARNGVSGQDCGDNGRSVDVSAAPNDFVILDAALAVRDSGAQLARVGYHLTLVGVLEQFDVAVG
jgi:hypothetical protein